MNPELKAIMPRLRSDAVGAKNMGINPGVTANELLLLCDAAERSDNACAIDSMIELRQECDRARGAVLLMAWEGCISQGRAAELLGMNAIQLRKEAKRILGEPEAPPTAAETHPKDPLAFLHEAPVIKKDSHYEGCPARDGRPVCTCGGRYA